jgi:hypothetical protein
MRGKQAAWGFLIVPCWRIDGQPIDWQDDFRFEIPPPRDGSVRVAVLGVNLLKPLAQVKSEAAKQLSNWLRQGK